MMAMGPSAKRAPMSRSAMATSSKASRAPTARKTDLIGTLPVAAVAPQSRGLGSPRCPTDRAQLRSARITLAPTGRHPPPSAASAVSLSCSSGSTLASAGGGHTVALQQEPEHEHVRDQEQRYDDGRNEVGCT